MSHLLGRKWSDDELDSDVEAQLTAYNDLARQKLRHTGYSAFTSAGGSRVEFERFWPAALNEINPPSAAEEQ